MEVRAILIDDLPSYLFQQRTFGNLAGRKNNRTAMSMAGVESRTKGLKQKKPKEMRVGIHLALANGFISLYSPFTVFRE